MTPLETSIWWIQYVLANGGELTKSHAPNMSWFAYHSVDVMLLLGTISICAVYGIFVLFKICMNRAKSRCNFENKKRD